MTHEVTLQKGDTLKVNFPDPTMMIAQWSGSAEELQNILTAARLLVNGGRS